MKRIGALADDRECPRREVDVTKQSKSPLLRCSKSRARGEEWVVGPEAKKPEVSTAGEGVREWNPQ